MVFATMESKMDMDLPRCSPCSIVDGSAFSAFGVCWIAFPLLSRAGSVFPLDHAQVGPRPHLILLCPLAPTRCRYRIGSLLRTSQLAGWLDPQRLDLEFHRDRKA